jgi:(2Fe-2S) ferredoxin
MKPKKHIFVCTHDRPPGDPRGSCKERGAKAVLDALKGELFNEDLLEEAKASGSTCLGHCEHGVTAVVYPDATWYRGLTVEDAEDLVQGHFVDDEPVERLVLPDADL